MNSNEFVYWLKGIVDSTDFMPTKKTWDLIVDVVGTVKVNKKPPPTPNPYDITCEKKQNENNSLKK